MKAIVDWFITNIDLFDLFFLICIIIYRRGIFTAIAGGNGKLQMTELAQAIILCLFYISVRAERLRPHEYSIFPDTYWISLFAAVTVIAGIKEKVFHKSQPKEDLKPPAP